MEVLSARGTLYRHIKKQLGACKPNVIMYVLPTKIHYMFAEHRKVLKISVCDLRGHGARDRHRSIKCQWLSVVVVVAVLLLLLLLVLSLIHI